MKNLIISKIWLLILICTSHKINKFNTKVGYVYIENNPGYSLSINLAKSITEVLENNLTSLNRVNNLIKYKNI